MQKNASKIVFIGIILVVFGVLFWPSLLGYPIQGIDGSIGIIQAVKNSAYDSLGQWHSFYWMGNGSVDFYPSLYYFAVKLLPSMWMQNIYYPVVLLIAMLGMFVWLRSMGRSFWASLLGMLLYGLMPHWVSLIYGGHILVFELMMYFPWLGWLLSRTFREKSWKWTLWAILSGVVWGSFMNCDIQRGFYLSLVLASMMVFLWYQRDREKFLPRLPYRLLQSAVVTLFLLATFSISLPGWLSALEGRKNLSQQTSSLGGWEFATQFSQDPRELIDSLAFGYHGKLTDNPDAPYWGTKEFNGNSDSLGFFLVVFGIMGFSLLFHKETSSRDKQWLGFWGIWFLIGLLLAFGKFFPGKPFYWLFYHLPLMSSFRVPLKWLIVAGVALVMGASFAIDRLFLWAEEANKDRWKKLTIVSLSLFGFSVLVLFYHAISSDSLYQNLYPQLKGFALSAVETRGWAIVRMAGLSLFLVASSVLVFLATSLPQRKTTDRQRSKTLALVIITVGIIFDLTTINGFYFDKAFVKQGPAFYNKDEILSNLTREQAPFRVATSLLVEQQNRIYPIPASRIRQYYLTYDFLYHGIEAFDVPAESTVDSSFQRFLLANWRSQNMQTLSNINDALDADLPTFQMANVKYLILDMIVTNKNYPLIGIWKDKFGNPHAIYTLSNSFPRVKWFSEAVSVPNEDEAFLLLSQSFWKRDKILIVENGKPLSTPASSATVEITSYRPTRIQLQVDAASEGYILLSSRFHKQWKASLDGNPTPILKANIAQMAILIPPGKHAVVFSYKALILPQILGWGSWALAILLGIFLLLSPKSSPEEKA